MCDDQCGTDPGVKADLLIDGARIGLEGASLPTFGLAEHRSDQAVEQIDSLVREVAAEVQADGNQRGMSTLTLVAGNVLYSGPVGLAHKLGETRLVDEMSARSVNADPPHMLQAFNQTEHGGGCGRFWHLTQPSQPVLTTVLSALRQRIETLTLLSGQAIGQPMIDFLPSAMADIDAEPFECRRPW
jgi:hypothetical protein